jgi:hypothetical protein
LTNVPEEKSEIPDGEYVLIQEGAKIPSRCSSCEKVEVGFPIELDTRAQQTLTGT